MTLNPIRPLAVAAMFALASPASAVVVAHDAHGAYLAVTKDAYIGGKYAFPVATRAPVTVPAPVTALPSAPAVPAIDPVVVAVLAVLLAIVLLSSSGDDGGSNVSDTLLPEPEPAPPAAETPVSETPELPFTPPFEEPPRQENRPRPEIPAVPLPPALLLLLSGIGGLAWAGRRKA